MIRNFIRKSSHQKTTTTQETTPAAITSEEMITALMCRNLEVQPVARMIRTVILCNPHECSGIKPMALVSAWCGTGKVEFEWAMAKLFLAAVQEALANDKSEADISSLFSVDMMADSTVFTSQQIFDHIIKWFDIVEENENNLKVKLKIAA